MKRTFIALAFGLSLSACATTAPLIDEPHVVPNRPNTGTIRPVPPAAPPPPPVEGFRMPQIMSGPGLAGIIRERAPTILRQFGTPRLDVAEGDMRKLQFTTQACVMDIFLYPLQPDGEQVVTWIETRRASDGADVDMFSCMQVLRQRGVEPVEPRG